MSAEHEHEWSTRYTTIDQVDCASGMECKCGVKLDQQTVEDVVNEAKPPADFDAQGHAIPRVESCFFDGHVWKQRATHLGCERCNDSIEIDCP